ncbi:MAG: hypothetical protein HYX94_08785 [Chloroflexi bacterium]|nr:hypothetical protein [Chloroflexota bacterium]
MLSKLRLTLRQKIVVYCLLAVSPVVLFAYFLVDENSSYVKQQSLDRIDSQANLAQLALDELIDTWLRFLDNLAQMPPIKSGDKAGSQQILTAVFPLYSNFITTLAAVDEEGQIVTGVSSGDSSSFNVSDRPYFRVLLRTGKPVVSDRLIGRSTGQPVFVAATPIKDGEGRVTGAVAAGASLRQIQALLDRIGQGAGDAIVVGSDGVVLSHPDWQYMEVETNLKSLAPVGLALGGKRGTTEHADPLGGGNWLWSYQPLTKAPWAVAIKYPVTAVNAPMYSSLLRWSFYLVGSLALALALASFSANRIAQPFRRLAGRLALAAPSGDGEKPSHADLDDLHQLARVFNGICDTLTQTSNELAGVKEELAVRARKLETMTKMALEAREEERRRIAMSIHDGVLQLIGAAQLEARLVQGAGPVPDAMSKRLNRVELVLEQALTDLRGISRGLCPPDLTETGLVFAVYSHLIMLRETYRIPRVSLYVSGEAHRLHAETENAAFRIVQESLANAAKHAQAKLVEVFIDFTPALLRLVVADDGRGFNLRDVDSTQGDHCGLTNMRERAAGVCGTCAILSIPEGGTRVEAEVPM